MVKEDRPTPSRLSLGGCEEFASFFNGSEGHPVKVHADELPSTDLVTAILIDDIELVETELQTFDVNKADAGGCTPLHYASFVGNAAVIEKLIEHGARLDTKDANGITPLHRAMERDHAEAVDRLLSSGATLGVQCRVSQTPLHVAAIHNSLHSARLLLRLTNEYINKTDKTGSTCLHHAAYYGNLEFVKLLAEFGVDFTRKDDQGRTGAHWAAIGGNDQVLRELRKSGADLTLADKRGRTPLHYASFTCKASVTEFLVRQLRGSAVDVRDNEGFTPLHYAAQTGNAKALKILLEAGADIACEAADGTTVGHIAASTTNDNCALDTLLAFLATPNNPHAKGIVAALNAKRKGGYTPLHMACNSGKVSKVDNLVYSGVIDPEAKADGGIRPLHVAVRNGHELVVKHLLLTHHVEVNSQLRDGTTALHLAASHSLASTVKMLVDCGADVTLADNKKRTALHLAAFSSNDRSEFTCEELLRAKSNVSARDVFGYSPLHYAASRGKKDVVDKLIRAGAETKATDEKKRTALHLACYCRNPNGVAQSLVRANEKLVDEKDASGFYPIHYSAAIGNDKLTTSLFRKMKTTDLPSSGHPLHLTPLHVAAIYDRQAVIKGLLAEMKAAAEQLEQGYKQSLATRIGLETDSRGRIPLHYAMQKGYLECAKMLFSSASHAKQLNHEERSTNATPVHFAAANRHAHCLQWALSTNEVLVNKIDRMRRTCGMLALTSRTDSPILCALLDKSELTRTDANNRGYVHRAVAVSNTRVLRKLFDNKLDVNVSDAHGATPLHVASAVGEREVVAVLVGAGASTWTVDDDGRTAADWAAATGQIEALETLAPISPEGDPALDQSGDGHEGGAFPGPSRPPPPITSDSILLAAFNGHADCLHHLLLLSPSLVSATDQHGRSPLHLAAYQARLDCVELLLEARADLEAMDEMKRTPLMMAALNPKASSVLEHLLEHGASIAGADDDGNNVFHLVCHDKNEEGAMHLVEKLKAIENGEERNRIANAPNNMGETPLHLIVRKGLSSFIYKFIPHAEDSIWMKDSRDRLPLTSAVEEQDVVDCMNLILTVSAPDEESRQRLSIPSRHNSHSNLEEFY